MYAHTYTRTHCQPGAPSPANGLLFVSDGQVGLFAVGGFAIVPNHCVFLPEYIIVPDFAELASFVLHSLPRLQFW